MKAEPRKQFCEEREASDEAGIKKIARKKIEAEIRMAGNCSCKFESYGSVKIRRMWNTHEYAKWASEKKSVVRKFNGKMGRS